MNIKDYISSGILEAYALGLASEEEKRHVEELLIAHPELNSELDAIHSSLENLAQEFSKEPPASLKNRILEKLDAGKDNEKGRVVNLTAPAKKSPTLRLALAASIALFAVSVAVNFILYKKWRGEKDKLVAMEKEKEVLAQQFSTQKTSFEKMNADVQLMLQPSNKMIVMKGVEKHPGMASVVFWNHQSHEVYISVTNLPSPPEGMQYQLWALKDGKPIDAGVFDMDSAGMVQKVKNIEAADAFAVTMEKKGGSPVPTLEQLYVMGNI